MTISGATMFRCAECGGLCGPECHAETRKDGGLVCSLCVNPAAFETAEVSETAAERDRLQAVVDDLVGALRRVESGHEYTTPAGTTNCRFCDNNMDDEGTYENMHAETCVIVEVRAAIRKAKP